MKNRKHRNILTLVIVLGLSCSAPLSRAPDRQTLEVRLVPGDHIYANVASPSDGQFDAMVHAIGILNDGDEPLTIQAVEIDVLVGNISILTKRLDPASFVRDTNLMARMVQNGEASFVAGMVGDADGPAGLFGRRVDLSTEPSVPRGSAIFSIRHFLAFDRIPDAIRVSVQMVSPTGEASMATRELKVIAPDKERAYPMPLEGGWYVTAIPLVTSHHRYMSGTEFAVDLFKSDGEGNFFDGDRIDQASYFGYGEPVHAIAGGIVVRVINGTAEDAAFRVRRYNESAAVYDARMIERFGDHAEVNLLASIAGNQVTVEQDDGYYASYCHLAASSIESEEGARVEIGDVIAAVGGTGEDNATTHLHIQLNEGSMLLFDQSVPMRFVEDRTTDTGRFIRSE